MMQVIQQTGEEKLAMYMKMSKKKIAEMLIQCNKVLDGQHEAYQNSVKPVLPTYVCKCGSIKLMTLMNKTYCVDCRQEVS